MSSNNKQSVFLHGLESSSKGTKARFFAEHFPKMLIPDFHGNFQNRLTQLKSITQGQESLVLVGSSFGGLMATAFATQQPGTVQKLILLAPALNFPDFPLTKNSININTTIFHGKDDTVCPHNEVLAIAEDVFVNLTFNSVEDNHMLHSTFRSIPWLNYFT